METSVRWINRSLFAGMLVFCALLPLHAFLKTWFTDLFTASTVDELSRGSLYISAWKEGVLALLAVLVLIRSAIERKLPFQITIIDWCIAALAVVGIASRFVFDVPWSQWIWGARTDFGFLVVYAIARSTPFDRHNLRRLLRVTVWIAAIVVTAGILLKFVLPQDFLLEFGYSPYTSSYVDNKPIPLYHCQYTAANECIPRLASTLSGPNQYGTYLLLVIAIIAGLALYGSALARDQASAIKASPSVHAGLLLLLAGSTMSLFWTYSQGAWVSALALFVVLGMSYVKHMKLLLRDGLIIGTIAIIGFIAARPWRFLYLIKDPSTIEHVEQFWNGLLFIGAHPWGVGLGNAGPVSERFFGDQRGLIAESWYLQITQEMGIIGGLLWIIITALVLKTLWKELRHASDRVTRCISLIALLALSAVSVDALVLHAWADSTTAWLVWMFVGIAVARTELKETVTSVLSSPGVAAFGRPRTHLTSFSPTRRERRPNDAGHVG